MNFIYQDGLFIKSNNSVYKIMNRYVYSILPFLLISILYNVIALHNYHVFITIILTNLVCIITQYIINIIKRDYLFKNVFVVNNILILSLMLSLFTIDTNIVVLILISIFTTLFKNILNINNKAILISIILLNIYKIYYLKLSLPLDSVGNIFKYDEIIKYSNLRDYLLGLNNYYLSALLSLFVFIYLFIKKSIKFIIPICIILTYSFIVSIVGIMNGAIILYPLFNIITGNIMFLSVFAASDYINTPITFEGSLIYGILIGIFTSIFRYIIPEFSIAVSILICSLLTEFLDKISFKLKYNKKIYCFIIFMLMLFSIITSISLGILIK